MQIITLRSNALALNLSRNTRVWVSTVKTGHNNTNTWEIGVQDGYSFSQSTSSTDVTVEEAGLAPTRGSKRFNDSLDPVDWSFTTYLRPYKLSATHAEVGLQSMHMMADAILWHSLASGSAPDLTDDAGSGDQEPPIYGDVATGFTVKFTDNSYHELTELFIYFKVDNTVFLVEEVQVGSAEIGIDISDIGQVAWSGQGTKLVVIAEPAFMTHAGLELVTVSPTPDSYVANPTESDYLINRYTAMTLESSVSGAPVNYDIAITAASVSINNNITYLTPTTLGAVDKPIGSFTGTFEVSGSVDCYLNDKANGSLDLFNHLAAFEGVTSASDLTFYIGGRTELPRIEIGLPTAHLNVPEITTDDVISQSMEFRGISATEELNDGQEIDFLMIGT